MATNDFIPFATGGGANVESQSAYLIDPQVPIGQQPGVAKSALNNKALRQGTYIAACLAQYLANITGNNVLDDGVMSEILATMKLAFAPMPSFFSGYVAPGVTWSTTSINTFADPTPSGSAPLVTRSLSNLSVTAAASNLPGLTFTPTSTTAVYEVSVTSTLFNSNAAGITEAQLTDGTTQIDSISTRPENSGIAPMTMIGLYKPGTTSPVTVKVQLSVNGNTGEMGNTIIANSLEWSLQQISQ